MPAPVRRVLLVLVAALVAASVAPAAAVASASPRSRPDRGPVPLPVFAGTSRTVARAAATITMRPSRAVPAADARPVGSAPRAATPSPAAPVASTHFDAIPQWKTDYPADPTGAIGVTNVVTAVNTAIAVYDRAGTQLLAPTDLASLVPGVQGQKFDPKIVYDQYTQTFVLTFLVRRPATRQSWVVVTTIPDATAADQTTWCGTKLHGDTVPRNGKQWADYPGLGYNGDSVTIGTNAFTFGGGFAYAQIYSIANADLFGTCDPATPVTFTPITGSATRNPGGTKAFTIQPAQTEGASNGDQYFLSWDENDAAVVVWRLRATAAGLRLTNAALPARRAFIPPLGTQAGGSYRKISTWWDPGDLRFVNAFYDADRGRIYAAHAVAGDLGPDTITGGYPESVIRWYDVELAGAIRRSSIARTGVVGAPEVDSGWPAVATDAAGNLFMTFSRASKPHKEYLSAWAAEIPPGTTKAQLTLLSAGTATMHARIPSRYQRWGDFNAINRDPADGSFVAMINQYAKGDGVSTTTRTWQQMFDLVSDG
jgi:hypothetical protein